MKEKYHPNEYIELLELCVRTTGLTEKSETILRSLCRKYMCREDISTRQYEALHNISVDCADASSEQKILQSIKFDGPVEPLPIFAIVDDQLKISTCEALE